MRIKAIELTWFRGAADPVRLEPNDRSMVVYGMNGSGKSSFVDAVEYVLRDGRIGHLAHEYSGKRQEKAVLNTHKPEGRTAELSIEFVDDDSPLEVEIRDDGTSAISGGEAAAMRDWDYRRTVLRQGEVAEFIHGTKGDKYSVLLPLLGLAPLEQAAENLRQLAKSVEEQSQLGELKGRLKEVDAKRLETFGTESDDLILAKIAELHAEYCPDKATTMGAMSRCEELKVSVAARIAESSVNQRRHIALRDAAALKLEDTIDAVRTQSGKLAGAVEPLIAEKLEVLQSVGVFVDKLGDEEKVKCPACGRSISVEAFQAHVKGERERLREIIDTFDTRKVAIGTLCDTVKSLKDSLGKADAKSWRDELAKGLLGGSFFFLDGINTETLRSSCGEEELNALEGKLLPLIAAAESSSKHAPPDAMKLSTNKQTVEVARAVIEGFQQDVAIQRAEALVSFINSLERGVREEIRLRSKTVIDEISTDIAAMWAILHPGEAIENVRLCVPKDADKAIDIGLKFYGVEQDSPRLTLSEGYRNSLGLCIFLAMAKRDEGKDRPILLDDVVVSLDRNHRGMIVELLEREFSGRQVVILTHDREWYTELRQQLAAKSWTFKVLLPYDTPGIGIRWSHKTTTFDDARAQLEPRPDSACNDARKIMDVELAVLAERLKIRLPYLRGDRNDKRMAHEFLKRFVADGKTCLQMKVDGGYVAHTDAIEALEKVDRLLITWGNRGSHTFDLAPPEAIKLIDACEAALESFKCSSCGRVVCFADAGSSKSVQCECGQIRWRYGKG